MSEYRGQPSPETPEARLRERLARDAELSPETYDLVKGRIDILLRSEMASPLLLQDAHPFREAVYQEEFESGQIGDAINDEDEVGKRYLWQNSDIYPPEEIEVVQLEPVGRGLATTLPYEGAPISKDAYIRFVKASEDASCSGILWLATDRRILAEAEMTIPTDNELGFRTAQFAGMVGLSAVWRAGLTDYEPGHKVMNRLVITLPLNEKMGQELAKGLSGLIDQSVEEQ